MTDKVITNKIGVSECKYFGGFGAECLKQDLMLSCDEHPNCEFKHPRRCTNLLVGSVLIQKLTTLIRKMIRCSLSAFGYNIGRRTNENYKNM